MIRYYVDAALDIKFIYLYNLTKELLVCGPDGPKEMKLA